MNKIATITSVIAVGAGLAGAPTSADAGRDGDRALAAIGGFIGGVLIASAAHDHHDRTPAHAYCEFDTCRDRYVVSHRHDYGRHNDYGPRREWVTVKVWVPGHYVVRYDDCGRRVRHYVRGRYEYRREYVIVDNHRGRGYGYGRRG